MYLFFPVYTEINVSLPFSCVGQLWILYTELFVCVPRSKWYWNIAVCNFLYSSFYSHFKKCITLCLACLQAFLRQIPSGAEQTSALLKDKAGNIPCFIVSLLSTKPNNAQIRLSHSVFASKPQPHKFQLKVISLRQRLAYIPISHSIETTCLILYRSSSFLQNNPDLSGRRQGKKSLFCCILQMLD